MDKRNHSIHGNCDPVREQVELGYFEGKRPLFKEAGDHVGKLLETLERDMLPEDETFIRYYSLAGLYDRLREDAALFPDTMDQRFGAWAQLLVLFRMIHDGAESGGMRLPKRNGVLFDPNRFTFLEGRPSSNPNKVHERIEPPLVPDGTIYRALEKLLVLDGERISYRALDVEQIGSVYETMMGFRLEKATGPSVAVKAQKRQGAPTSVDLEVLLDEPAVRRDKWIEERADRKLTDTVKQATAKAATLEELHAALLPVIDHAATPDIVLKGAMVLQPSKERRRSGSHYTPRALTEPIVRTTLAPILARLSGSDGRAPRAAQILDLKVCDPAMGSGAFLVEACRQLGDALVETWHLHGEAPAIPPDEDEVIFARRLIAQRCLYGVDRNPVAVDLAKVSLWLATLAKDHALTFVDHSLRHGDSLVGLARRQIEALNCDGSKPTLKGLGVREPLEKASELRKHIREADESVSDRKMRDLFAENFSCSGNLFAGNPLPEFCCISWNLLDCFAAAVISAPHLQFPPKALWVRCRLGERRGALLLALVALLFEDKQVFPLEMHEEDQVCVASSLRVLTKAKGFALRDIYWEHSQGHVFFSFEYPGQMLRNKVPDLGEPDQDGKVRWPECEVIVGVVGELVQERAKQVVSFHRSDLDTSNMI